jgi:hypothetical protein
VCFGLLLPRAQRDNVRGWPDNALQHWILAMPVFAVSKSTNKEAVGADWKGFEGEFSELFS